MCDLEDCTTGTIGLPNPNQRSVVKTSGFLHPYIYRYTARALLRERFLALAGEGITWIGQPSGEGIALFSVGIEFWRSTGPLWVCNRTTIIEAEDRRSRGYERANSSSDFTSFSLASSVRSAARYLVRASPFATRSFPAPQVNSALPYFTATTSAIIRA
jgi:hypothetical protein